MIQFLVDRFMDLMTRGGLVMWPLLLLSVVGMTLCFERAWFWIRTNHPGRLLKVARLTGLLRQGDLHAVRTLVAGDTDVYSRVVAALLTDPTSEALAIEAVESQRSRLERFMPTLSTIITAAPMLGILGTVTGIIASFDILSDQTTTDPRAVSQGIAEALLTTAVGLLVALLVLFPYNGFRAQLDRTLSRLETLVAAARHQASPDQAKPGQSPPSA